MREYTDDEGITYDEDCPPLTEAEVDETLYLMKKYNTRIITKEIYEREFAEKNMTA